MQLVDGTPIPLPNVPSKTLEKVLEYCKHHYEHPPAPLPLVAPDRPLSGNEISQWDAEFCKIDITSLFELILAANYLDIKSLLEVTCRTVANMIKGKTPEQIRLLFSSLPMSSYQY